MKTFKPFLEAWPAADYEKTFLIKLSNVLSKLDHFIIMKNYAKVRRSLQKQHNLKGQEPTSQFFL